MRTIDPANSYTMLAAFLSDLGLMAPVATVYTMIMVLDALIRILIIVSFRTEIGRKSRMVRAPNLLAMMMMIRLATYVIGALGALGALVGS